MSWISPIVSTIVGVTDSSAFRSTTEKFKDIVNPLRGLPGLEEAMGNIPRLLQLSEIILEERKMEGLTRLVTRFRKAAYDAEDLMDELEYNKLKLEASPAVAVRSSSLSSCISFVRSLVETVFSRIATAQRIQITVKELNRATQLLREGWQQDILPLIKASSNTSGRFASQQGSTSTPPSSRVTTSTESKTVYGRDKKRDEIIKALETRQSPGNNTLISIVGLFGVGGVGKTTLARYVFNNEKFPEYFYSKVWNHVSDEYVHKTIIKEMIMGTASSKEKTSIELQSITNMDALERMLKDNLKNKQLLLVLDDVWCDQWTEILPVLHTSNNLNAKIVVTTREKKNLKLPMKFSRDCKNQILELEGLDDVEYRRLFDEHSFGAQGPSGHQNGAMLQSIGWQIANKLKGNPLAAETVGAVLEKNKEVWYWSQILNSNLCSIDVKNPRGIMPVLLLSYLHLPTHLQRCFSYCAIFPKDYIFKKEDLVNMWIAQSYVSCSKEGERPEDIGLKQFEDLVLRSFFKQAMMWENCYKMHDLLYDLAMFVSLEECCVCHLENLHRVPETCHHLFIPKSSKLPGVLTGQLPESLKLQLEHVRTLVINIFDETTTLEILKSLKKVRALKCRKIRSVNEVRFPNIDHIIHIRYLDFSTIRIANVPETICTLYHLQTLIFNHDIEIKFPEQMCNLVNLRHLIANSTSIAGISFIGKLSKLQELAIFDCQYNNIGQLMEMNDLGGELKIANIDSVEKIDDALNARLEKKLRLKKLELEWEAELGSGAGSVHHDEVLKCLRPNEQLEQLHIKGHPGYTPPSWIAPSSLKYIQHISLSFCSHWQSLSGIAKMLYLKSLSMTGMSLVIELDNEHAFPSLEELTLEKVSLSLRKSEEAATVRGKIFPMLQNMELIECRKLEGLMMPSLKHLKIKNCNVELPSFIKGVSFLTTLSISCHDKFTSFNREVMNSLLSLKKLSIDNMSLVIELDNEHVFPSLEELTLEKVSLSLKKSEEAATVRGKIFPLLKTMRLADCQKLEGLTGPLSLKHLTIDNSDVELPAFLKGVSSLSTLKISNQDSFTSFDRELMDCLSLLDMFTIAYCKNLRSLPEGGFPILLQDLTVIECSPELHAKVRQLDSSQWFIYEDRSRGFIHCMSLPFGVPED